MSQYNHGGVRRVMPPPSQSAVKVVRPQGLKALTVVTIEDRLPTWQPRKEVLEIRERVPVKCIIQGKDKNLQWRRGDLHPYPGQTEVPLVVSDSLLKLMENHPTSIQLVRCGATAGQLVDLIIQMIPELSVWQPKKFWVVFVGGGNDLCAGKLSVKSPKNIIEAVLDPMRKLQKFCTEGGHSLTIANLMPRPREMCRGKWENDEEGRQMMLGAYFALNEWIEKENEREGSPPLLLNKFFHHGPELRQRNRRCRQRKEPGIGCRKIRTGRFRRDGVHLAPKGLELVGGEIYKMLESRM